MVQSHHRKLQYTASENKRNTNNTYTHTHKEFISFHSDEASGESSRAQLLVHKLRQGLMGCTKSLQMMIAARKLKDTYSLGGKL